MKIEKKEITHKSKRLNLNKKIKKITGFSEKRHANYLVISGVSGEVPYRIGVAVFVENPKLNAYLIGKRKGSLDSGNWGLPGGHMEPNETIEECAKRELLEETGLEIKNIKHVTFTDDNYPAECKRYITLFVSAQVKDNNAEPKLMEPEKCEEWKWHKWNDEPPKNCSMPMKHLNKQIDFCLVNTLPL